MDGNLDGLFDDLEQVTGQKVKRPAVKSAPKTSNTPYGNALTQDQLEDALRQAGWDEKLIPTMSAIGMAESALTPDGRAKVNSYNPGIGAGGRPTAERSYGNWQINMLPSLGRNYDIQKLQTDPVYTAKAALDIYRQQGLKAWGAYTDGRYKKFYKGKAMTSVPDADISSLSKDYEIVAGKESPADLSFLSDDFNQVAGQVAQKTLLDKTGDAVPFIGGEEVPIGTQTPAITPTVANQPLRTPAIASPSEQTDINTITTDGSRFQLGQTDWGRELGALPKEIKLTDGRVLKQTDKDNYSDDKGSTYKYDGDKVQQLTQAPERPAATESDYQEYLKEFPNFAKKGEKPLSQEQFFAAASQNVGKDVSLGYRVGDNLQQNQSVQTQPIANQTQVSQPVQPNSQEVANTSSKNTVVKTDDDLLKTQAGVVAVDFSKKPKTMGGAEFLRREYLKQLQPRFGYTDEQINAWIERNRGKLTDADDYWNKQDNTYTTNSGKSLITVRGNRNLIAEVMGGLNESIRNDYKQQQEEADFQNALRDPLKVGDTTDELQQSFETDDARQEIFKRRDLANQNIDLNLYRQAEENVKRNPLSNGTQADIDEEYRLLAKSQVSPERRAQLEELGRGIRESDDSRAEMAGGFLGTLAETVGDYGAGISRLFGGSGLLGAVNDDIYSSLRSLGNGARIFKNSAKRDDLLGEVNQFVGSAGVDVPKYVALSALPGGAVLAFGVDAGLRSAGQGKNPLEIGKETAKGIMLGGLFRGASKLEGLAERGLLNTFKQTANPSPDVALAAKLFGGTTRIGTIGVGTYNLERGFGADKESAFKSAILMSLTDLAFQGQKFGEIKDLAGKVFRMRNSKTGESADVTVESDGSVKLLKGKVPENAVDAEMDLANVKDVEVDADGVFRVKEDVSPVRAKEQAETPLMRGNRLGTSPEPKSLESQNPMRAETAKAESVEKVSSDPRAQKISEILSDGKAKSVEEIAKATRYKADKVSETLMNLFDARKVEILPDNRVRLIGDVEVSQSLSLYEQAQQRLKTTAEESKTNVELNETKTEVPEVSPSNQSPQFLPTPEVSEFQKVEQRTKNVYENLPQQKEQVEEVQKPKAQVDFKARPDLAKSLTVFTERGRKAQFEPRVVDESDLLTSLDEGYPMEFQPRDRTRLASKAQISEIANKLNPEFLGDSPKASDGRPLVVPVTMPDGKTKYAVISGNGRTQGIREAYNLGNEPSKAYQEFAKTKGDFSFPKPVYVGVLDPEQIPDFSEFAKESNESSVAQMSASEQAKADADRLDSSVLNLFVPSDDGTIHGAANREFVRAFLDRTTSTSERNRFIDSEGKLNQEGVTRVKNAIFAKAFGGSKLGMATLQRMAESTDSNIKNITNALLAKAGELSSFAEAAKEKRRFKELDIAPDFARAMEKYSELKDSNTSIEEYIQQGNLFGSDTSPLQTRVMQVFDFYKRRTKSIRRIIDNYISASEAVGDPNQQGLFGDSSIPSKESIFEGAVRSYEREDEGETAEEVGLFDQDKRRENEPAARSESDVVSAKEEEKREVKEPHQMTRAEFLDADKMDAEYRSQYAENGEVKKSSREFPSETKIPPVGSWRITNSSKYDKYGDGIEQLREIPVDKITVSEDVRGEGRITDAERYAEWIKEGKQPPPLRVSELPNGKYKISDGHRRLEGHKIAGKKTILAWVSPIGDTGLKDSEGKMIDTDLTHQLAVEKALKEGKTVPASVLADYPDLKSQETTSQKSESFPDLKETDRIRIQNEGYRAIKAKEGERFARKYFEQVDKLFNPRDENIIEYRRNGVVIKEGDKYTFHAISDTDLKTWRRVKDWTVDVTDEFTATKQPADERINVSGRQGDRTVLREVLGEKHPLVREPFHSAQDIENYVNEIEGNRKEIVRQIQGSNKNKKFNDALDLLKGKAERALNKGNWRQDFERENDDFRKAQILRAVADVSRSEKELSDILEKAVGLPEESNIVWSVVNNKEGKPLLDKALALPFKNPNTKADLLSLKPAKPLSPTQRAELRRKGSNEELEKAGENWNYEDDITTAWKPITAEERKRYDAYYKGGAIEFIDNSGKEGNREKAAKEGKFIDEVNARVRAIKASAYRVNDRIGSSYFDIAIKRGEITPQEVADILKSVNESVPADIQKQIKLSPTQKAEARRTKSADELKELGLEPLGEKGQFGQTSHKIRTAMFAADSDFLSDLAKVFNVEIEGKGQNDANAVLDAVAESIGRDRSSQISPSDWQRILEDNADKLSDNSIDTILDALTHQEAWNKDLTAFIESPEIDTILDRIEKEIGFENIGEYKNLPLDIRKAILTAGRTYAKLSDQTIRETFQRGLQTALAEKSERAVSGKEKKQSETSGENQEAQDDGIQFTLAWHGSPHRFDKFDISKIGTGEGAQAYGHGLYFTDKESVADFYRNALTERDLKFGIRRKDGVTLEGNPGGYLNGDAQTDAILALRDADGDFDAAIATYENALRNPNKLWESQTKHFPKVLQELKDLRDEGYEYYADKPSGAKYKVDLKPEESDYLLWDKPLSEQSEKIRTQLADGLKELRTTVANVRQSLREGKGNEDFLRAQRNSLDAKIDKLRLAEDIPDIHGRDFYDELRTQFGQREASEILHSLGIRGIKYLDGSSRGKGEGSYNYVIFDDKDVEIDSILFSIIGERGASRLTDSVQRLDNLAIARQMESDGKDAKTIWLATGWERNKTGDSKWKNEIPDGDFITKGQFYRQKLKDFNWKYDTLGQMFAAHPEIEAQGKTMTDYSDGKVHKLGDVFHAPELFKAYPELKDYKVQYKRDTAYYTGERGSFEPETKTITFQELNDARTIVIHEIQHAIQYIEDFAKGGNVQSVTNLSPEERDEIHAVAVEIRKAQRLKESGEWAYESSSLEDIIKAGNQPQNIKDWAINIVKAGDDAIEEFIDNTPIQQYRRLAGEVEARNTEKRLTMSDVERANKTLSETEDIDRRSQIYLKRGLGVANSVDFASFKKQDQYLSTRLEHLNKQRTFDLAKVASAEHDTDKNILKVNPAGIALMRHLIEKLQGGSTPFYGFYATPGMANKLRGQIYLLTANSNPEVVKPMKEFLKAVDDAMSNSEKDLAVVIDNKSTPLITKYSTQEELSHRADYRVREFTTKDLAPYQNLSGYKKAINNLRQKGYKNASLRDLHNEVIAKGNREDAPEQLGITWDEIDEILNIYDNQLFDDGVTGIVYRTEYAKISQKADERVKAYEQRTSGNSGKNVTGSGGKTGISFGRGGEIRQGSDADSTKTIEREDVLRQTDLFDRIRKATELSAAERNFVAKRTVNNPELRSAVEDEIAFAKAGEEKPKVSQTLLNWISAPKSLKASFDLSGAGRQGLIPSAAHPLLAKRAFIQQLKSLVSQKEFDKFKRDLNLHPYIDLAEDSGLYLATLADQTNLAEREEAFMSKLFGEEKMFSNKVLEGVRKYNPFSLGVRASERAYVTYLDKLRIEVFTKLAKQIHSYNARKGRTDEAEQYQKLADFINYATGRGSLGKFNDAAPYLNAAFFSARYWASRLQVMNPVFYAAMPPGTRKAAVTDFAKFVGGVGLFTALLALLGFKVDRDDPANPDVIKVKHKNYSYDLSGGLISHLRFATRMAMASQSKKPLDEMQYLSGRYVRSKLAPVPAGIFNSIDKKNFIGEPTDWKSELISLPVPLQWNSFYEAAKADGTLGLIKSMPEFFGIGTTRYKQPDEIKEEIEKEKSKIKPDMSKEDRKEVQRRLTLWNKLLKKAEKSSKKVADKE